LAARLSPNIQYVTEAVAGPPIASTNFRNIQALPVLERYLGEDLRHLVERKAKVIRHWIDTGRLAEVDPYHLVFLIWAATQHYADFTPQVTAVMGRKTLSKAEFDRIEESLCRIILDGLLPRGEG
jgi:TetR/AcrR family transcriptional regulator